MHAALLCLLLAATPAAPDTLVICPAEFRPALVTWEDYRRRQGHEILVIDPPNRPADIQATIRRVALGGQLKYLVLIGDVPETQVDATQGLSPSAPTNYVPAKINTRWGSEPMIASDIPYCDLDGDGVPDLAAGRVPADSIEELAVFVRKVIRYERQATPGPWERRLNVVAGGGGFGAVADAVIEAAGRHVIQQTVPPDYEVRHTPANPAHPNFSPGGAIRGQIRAQFSAGSLAWIYLGHGLPCELDRVPTPVGPQPILSVADVHELRCGPQSALAVLIACYTGSIDAPRDCLAEELSLADQGPVAVIAATRVTMPYGNTVLGYELLRACFHEHPAVLGDILRLAQRRTLGDATGDALRSSLDAIAQGISPPPLDLAAERSEHVLMYHLLGDPLLRLRRAPEKLSQIRAGGSTVK